MTRDAPIRLALTMPRRLLFKSTDHHYLYRRLPKLSEHVPIEVIGHTSWLTHVAVSARFILCRAKLARLDALLFGSDLLMPIGRLPPCDVVFSYGFFPRFAIDRPIVWEQTFAAATFEADPKQWRSRLQRAYGGAVARATRVVTATEHSAAVFREHFPRHADKIAVVPYFFPGLDIRPAEEVTAKHRAPDAPVEILFVGKAARRKGLDTLCDAMRLLSPQTRGQLKVTAVSAMLDGSVALPNDVTHHTFVDDIDALFRRAQLFVFPTKEEAFGLVLVEAMAAGCGILTTANPLQVSIVGEPGGLFVDPHDAVALSRALEDIVADRERLARMGAHNRERAAAIYAPDVVAERLHGVLAGALAEHELKTSHA